MLGHVGIHNAGRLPAHNVRWFIDIKASPNGVEKEFRIGELSGDVVAPSGVTMPRGTRRGMLAPELNAQSCSPVKVRSEESPVFLYVWAGSLSRRAGRGTLDTLLPSLQLGHAR